MTGNDTEEDLKALVPKGAAYQPVESPGPTRAYAFVLVPGFTLLAFTSAVEPLRIANQLSQKPLYRWHLMSPDGAPATSSSGIEITVGGALSAQNKEVRLFVCAGNPAMAAGAPAVVGAVQRHHRFGGTVGGICTGAVALAKAGVLADRRFTLHWENQPGFCETFPELEPTLSRYEIDARVITCGGGAAATDMMIALIAEDHGAVFAAMVSDMCLRPATLGVEPTQRSSTSAVMKSRSPLLVAAVNLMRTNVDVPLSIHDIAEAVGGSRRQLERLFVSQLNETPAVFYRNVRLDRARNLLATTDLSIAEISTACGFEASSHFTRAFKARFGIVPTKLKGRPDQLVQ
ncbi:GlxA family transcriptional regulator [Seohaeicola zhoushanensis]|uniref:AraC family transcriptional regulator n=1 Tax=Seohaeicola zhoushanensis TaxID=1569283 RepID=A0A8J3GY74_9RHOB|nr:GlxA family transcriptional regulator [Seohaeicola zhoushanensis]GHF49810.1 AraC family transcriptional regulator [Seohaeicola zhoushanensis]